ncbi:MAG: DUF4339 domain-containing protein [Bacteroidales bacterium]
MKKYYYTENGKTFGPHTIGELKISGINKDTYVWFEGMSEWAPAKDVAELAEIFPKAQEATPPKFSKIEKESPKTVKTEEPTQEHTLSSAAPYSWQIPNIVLLIISGGCNPLSIIGVICAASSLKHSKEGNIARAKINAKAAKLLFIIPVVFWVIILISYLDLIRLAMTRAFEQ